MDLFKLLHVEYLTFTPLMLLLKVCRNINKIKVCMETGNTVVLLNLENLYESLYDALNQVNPYKLFSFLKIYNFIFISF